MLWTGLFSKTFCYFTLIQERKTWSEARSYCKSYHTDLATIQSDEDRYKIQEIANAISFSHRAWMGLNDGVMAWRWSYRDLNIDYMNWASGEDTSSRTQRKCGVITVTGSWHVASCEEQKPSFCYNGKTSELNFLSWFVFVSIAHVHAFDRYFSPEWVALHRRWSVCASFSTVWVCAYDCTQTSLN